MLIFNFFILLQFLHVTFLTPIFSRKLYKTQLSVDNRRVRSKKSEKTVIFFTFSATLFVKYGILTFLDGIL